MLPAKEMILYMVFGVGTTAVNIGVFWAFTEWLGVHYMIANVAAWVLSVLFAFVTNKRYVFGCKDRKRKVVLHQFSAFCGGRLFSGLMDMAIMYVCIELGHMEEMPVKIMSNVLVIVVNYVFSKMIFQKNDDTKETPQSR